MPVLRLAQKDQTGEADLWPVQTPLAAPGFLQLLHHILALPLDSDFIPRAGSLLRSSSRVGPRPAHLCQPLQPRPVLNHRPRWYA